MHFTHTYSVFLCPSVLVPFPPYPSGHWHVVTVVRIIGDVLGSDERLLEVHAELSRAELAAFSADYTSSRLQERYCKRVFRGPIMAVAWRHLFAAVSYLFKSVG